MRRTAKGPNSPGATPATGSGQFGCRRKAGVAYTQIISLDVSAVAWRWGGKGKKRGGGGQESCQPLICPPAVGK